MVTDRGRSYDHALDQVKQQKCLAHVLRSISDVVDTKHGRGRSFGKRLQGLLREATHDIHVRRVLGRVFHGRGLSEDEATRLARDLSPDSPWLVDRPAYLIGKRFCAARNPFCGECPARIRCSHVAGGHKDSA